MDCGGPPCGPVVVLVVVCCGGLWWPVAACGGLWWSSLWSCCGPEIVQTRCGGGLVVDCGGSVVVLWWSSCGPRCGPCSGPVVVRKWCRRAVVILWSFVVALLWSYGGPLVVLVLVLVLVLLWSGNSADGLWWFCGRLWWLCCGPRCGPVVLVLLWSCCGLCCGLVVFLLWSCCGPVPCCVPRCGPVVVLLWSGNSAHGLWWSCGVARMSCCGLVMVIRGGL